MHLSAMQLQRLASYGPSGSPLIVEALDRALPPYAPAGVPCEMPQYPARQPGEPDESYSARMNAYSYALSYYGACRARTEGAEVGRNVSSALAISTGWVTFWSILGVVGTAAGAFHGYKRNHGSVGWGVGWALLGGAFPVITLPLSFAQGFGKPSGK